MTDPTRPAGLAQLTKELRQRTGFGLADCRAALIACRQHTDLAEEWLRVKGQAIACLPGKSPCERVEAEALRRGERGGA